MRRRRGPAARGVVWASCPGCLELLSGAEVSRLGLAVPGFAGERAGLALHRGERCDLLVAVGWSGGLFGHRPGGA